MTPAPNQQKGKPTKALQNRGRKQAQPKRNTVPLVKQTKTKQAAKNRKPQVPRVLHNYKISASDAPARVDRCEILRSFTYYDPVPSGGPNIHVTNGQFNTDVIFLWLPAFSMKNMMCLAVQDISNVNTLMKDYAIPGTSTSHTLRLSTKPPMELFQSVNSLVHARCMAINGSLLINTQFGGSNGLIRYKRYTESDTHRTPSELQHTLREGTVGVYRKSLSQSDTIVLHAGVQNKNHLSQYSSHMSEHWGYHEQSTIEENGLAPLSGWIFSVTNVSTSPMMPAPMMHIAAQVRLQRELVVENAYLEDTSPTIDPDTLSHCKRNEQPTSVFHGKTDDLRKAADTVTALSGATVAMLGVYSATRRAIPGLNQRAG